MQRAGASLLYSAKDLLNFLGCDHNTALDLERIAAGMPAAKGEPDPYLDLLQKKGIEHEQRYLDALHKDGRSIREIERVSSIEAMAEATRTAMRDGVDVIYQGALFS